MSVLHICCNYADSSVYETVFGRMASKGLAQQVYVPEKRRADMGKRMPPASEENLQVRYSLIVRPWDRVLYFTKGRRAIVDLPNQMALSEVGLVHAHTLFTDGAIAYRLHLGYGLPYVVSVRGTDLEYFLPLMPHLRRYGLRILENASAIHFLSPSARDKLFARYVPAQLRESLQAKAKIISNGIDADWFTDAPKTYRQGEPVRLAFAGKLVKYKYPLRAVEAMRQLQRLLPETGVSLHMAGEGPLRAALEACPESRNGRLVLHGQLDQAALRDFYDASTLFLLPSTRESFGLVYLEAMSRGLPVFYVRGQGFDGRFLPAEVGGDIGEDPLEMAEKMREVLSRYHPISRHNIEAVRAYDWDNIATDYLALYREVSP